jgi:hypothetical protein
MFGCYSRITEEYQERLVPNNPILNDKIVKNVIKKIIKNHPSRPKLTCQAYDLGHETEIASYKAN